MRSAARRWPAAIRDGMAAEWRAELAVLRRDPRLDPASRAWRRLAYALSLALSPSIGKENPMTLTWRDRLPGLGFAARRLALYTGVAFAAVLLPQATYDLWYQVSTHNGRVAVASHGATNVAGTLGAALLAAVAMILIGVAAARWTPRPAGRALAVAAFVTVPLGVGGYLLFLAQAGQTFPAAPTTDATGVGWGLLAWTVMATATMAGALRLAAAGRRVMATLTGAVGLLVAVDLAGALAGLATALRTHVSLAGAPLWAPLSFLPTDTVVFGHVYGSGDNAYHASSAIVSVVSVLVPPVLMSAAFLGAYLLSGRPAPVAVGAPVQVAPADVVPGDVVPAGGASTPGATGRPRRAPLVSAAVRGYAYAVAVVALGVWGSVLARVGPVGSVDYPMDDRNVLPSTALAAILLAVLAFVLANAGRGPVVAPAVGAFAVLATANRLVSAAVPLYGPIQPGPESPGPALAAAVFAFGVVVLATATWLTGRLGRTGDGVANDRPARRALAGVVVIATLSVPTNIQLGDLFRHRYVRLPSGGVTDPPPPLWLCALALTVVALLIATAFVAAVTARRDPLPRPAVAALAALAIAVAALPLSIGWTLRALLYWPILDFFGQPVLTVAILVVLCWRRTARPVLVAAGWVLAGGLALAVTVPLYEPLRDVANLMASILLPKDSFPGLPPYQLGPMALGIVLAALAGRWLVPPERGVSTATDPRPIGPDPAPGDPLPATEQGTDPAAGPHPMLLSGRLGADAGRA